MGQDNPKVFYLGANCGIPLSLETFNLFNSWECLCIATEGRENSNWNKAIFPEGELRSIRSTRDPEEGLVAEAHAPYPVGGDDLC